MVGERKTPNKKNSVVRCEGGGMVFVIKSEKVARKGLGRKEREVRRETKVGGRVPLLE